MITTPERQPREHAVMCRAGHGRRPVETWNLSGLCDRHELAASLANVSTVDNSPIQATR